MDSEYYTIEEVARLLKVSKDTIYREIQAGKLRAVKIGNQWRIHHSEIQRYTGK